MDSHRDSAAALLVPHRWAFQMMQLHLVQLTNEHHYPFCAFHINATQWGTYQCGHVRLVVNYGGTTVSSSPMLTNGPSWHDFLLTKWPHVPEMSVSNCKCFFNQTVCFVATDQKTQFSSQKWCDHWLNKCWSGHDGLLHPGASVSDFSGMQKLTLLTTNTCQSHAFFVTQTRNLQGASFAQGRVWNAPLC